MRRRAWIRSIRHGALHAALLLVLPATGRAEEAAKLSTPALSLPGTQACSLEVLLSELRAAQRSGSPAYRRYALYQMKESALSLPPEQLRAAFLSERDPAVIEALGQTLAARSSRTTHAAHVKAVLLRAQSDGDPAARAASVRGLRGVGSVAMMRELGATSYAELARDPSPLVQRAVADNLIHESQKIYFGHDGAVAEQAIDVAITAQRSSPQGSSIAAQLLREVSTESVGHGAAQRLHELLHASSPELRAGAALALGGVPASEAGWVQVALRDQLNGERELIVRKALVEALVHLQLGAAAATLQEARGRSTDAALSADLDAWLGALSLGLQEFSLIKREKERRLAAPR